MSEREEGWYWVKQKGVEFWECCQWNGYAWHGIWIESVPDSAFEEIGTRIPTPDEDQDDATRVSFNVGRENAGPKSIDLWRFRAVRRVYL